MSILHITIQEISDTDYDGNPITFKNTTSTIDGEPTHMFCNCDPIYTEEQIKTGHKAKLTEKGFTWDSEE